MKRKHFFIPDALLEKLEAKSRKTGATLSELVRRAIALFLANDKQ